MIISELPHAFKRIKKSPGFSIMAIIIFSVGIGLSLYIYTFINSLLYAEIEFKGSDKMIFMERKSAGNWRGGVSHYTFQEIKKNPKIFEHIGAFRMWWWSTINTENNSARGWTAYTTPSLFQMVGVSPILGRTLKEEDDIVGAEKVVVINYEIWQEVFDGSEDAIGAHVLIGTDPHTVVGVMPEGFAFPVKHEMWVPLQLEKTDEPFWNNDYQLTMFGKIDDDNTIESAKSQLDLLIDNLKTEFPEYYDEIEVGTFPINRYSFRDAVFFQIILLSIATAIMLLVCFNIGNILFARANENIKEVAIRSALGAPRFMLMQQVLAESLILCVIGAFLGISLAHISLSLTNAAMQSVFYTPTPYYINFELGLGSVLFAIVATLFTWLAAGLLPAWKASGIECNEALKDSNKGGASTSSRLTGFIVTIQIFLSCVLVSYAVDSVISLRKILNTDFGVDVSKYATSQLVILDSVLPTVETQLQHFEQLDEELENTPGIIKASFANYVVGEFGRGAQYSIQETDLREDGKYPSLNTVLTYNDYFSTIGVELIEGRGFSVTDTKDTHPVGIIDVNFANKIWGTENVIGKKLEVRPGKNAESITIIGVVSAFRQAPPFDGEFTRGTLYRPFSQALSGDAIEVKIIAEVTGEPHTYEEAIAKAARQVNPLLPTNSFVALKERINHSTMFHRFISSLFSIFAVISLALAATGIYSISSRSAVLRTHEFGIRRALGSTDVNIVGILMARATLYLTIGLSLGFVTTLIMFIAQSHADVSQKLIVDTLTSFAAVTVITTFTVFIASLFPALRAISMQPSAALHHE